MINSLKVLVIEDDEFVADPLVHALKQNGFNVLSAPSAGEGMTQFKEFNPEIVIVDLGLPDFSGNEVIEQIRNNPANDEVRIMVLTLDKDMDQKIHLLENGVDDFISKPVDYREVSARVKNLAKFQRNPLPNEPLRVGPLTVFNDRKVVELCGENLDLTLTEFEIFSILASNSDKVVTRKQITDSIWGGIEVTAKTLDAHLYSLRKKLPCHAIEIKTLRGRGFIILIKELCAA